jgi:hypothetical protein
MELRDRGYLLFSTSPSRGFSWWELVFIIGLSGTLLAFASPMIAMFMRCPRVDKAVNLPARKYITALNQAQQTYFLQHHQLATSVQSLNLSLTSPYTQVFTYSTRSTPQAIYNYAIARHPCVLYACDQEKVKSLVGAVFITPTSGKDKTTSTTTILCQSSLSSKSQLTEPTLKNGTPTCAPNTVQIHEAK